MGTVSDVVNKVIVIMNADDLNQEVLFLSRGRGDILNMSLGISIQKWGFWQTRSVVVKGHEIR